MNEPRVAIVGLGAIGGSVALVLGARGLTVSGATESADDAAAARAAGVRVHDSATSAAAEADIVLLAVPLDAIAALARRAAEAAPRATILHAGSLQGEGALALGTPLLGRVIGTHPMAGTHGSGFAAARADMFRGAVVSIESRATPRQREDAELLWSLAGAGRVEYRDAAAHDACMAWSSHLPQLVATALAAATARRDEGGCPRGPGLRDTTRLAASDWGMWRPILEHAPHDTRAALAAVEGELVRLREAMEARDWPRLRDTWDRAREWRTSVEHTS